MASPLVQKILVVHLAGIGDLIMGLPALHALRQGFPESRISLLTWRRSQDLTRLIPDVNERWALDERPALTARLGNLRVLRQLRRMRVDLAINCYQLYSRWGARKMALLFACIAPQHSAGRSTDGKGTFFTVQLEDRRAGLGHEVERQLALVERLGCPQTAGVGSLALDPMDQHTVIQWLADRGVTLNELLIGIHPGGARRGHRWPWRSFARVARALETRASARIVITGSRDERELAKRIAGELAHPLVAAGELSLGQLAWLWQRAQLVIANDSGPMHLAAALNIPLVAIMGPTDPQRYGPYPLDRADQWILHAHGCVPCYRNRCRGHEALEQLPAEAVLEAAQTILNGQHPRGLVSVPRRIRVLHVHTLPVISGSGINTFLSMQGLPKDRYTVELGCAPGGPLLDLVAQHGMVVRRLRHMVWPMAPVQDLWVVWELWRLMRQRRYAIVHTHNSKAGFVGRLAAWLAGVPVVIHTVHGFAFHAYERWWRRGLYRWLERLAAHWCDRLIMISQPLIEWAVQERIAPRGKMVKIYSGIDLSAFRQPVDFARLKADLGIQDHAFVVGEVAKLWFGKGHEILFRAAARLKDQLPALRLLIVGEGGLQSSLLRLAQALGIRDQVVFTGFRTDVPALTQVVDVAVLPTLYEGMGRAVLEAQAAGKPVIASRVGGIPDLIADGITGLLIEPGNVEQLASSIWRLYEQPQLRRQLGQAAQQAVDERFSAHTMVVQIVTLYEGLLRQKLGVQPTP